MGQKRYYDGEVSQEFSFKHPKQLDSTEQTKQLDSTEQTTSIQESNPSYGAFKKSDISGGVVGDFCDSLSKNGDSGTAFKLNDKEFRISTPVRWGTNSTGEDDIGTRTASYSTFLPELNEFSFPRRNPIQFEDTYSLLFHSSPRKEVPIGPDHQADIPVWDSAVAKKHSNGSLDDNTEYTGDFIKLSRVIPMLEFVSSGDVGKTNRSKLNCQCFDGGSVRCVQQHVKEAREKLKEMIGLKKFVDLGFLDMGEEVAYKWTEEEEELFHQVVYSNPVSHGRNFWEHLSTMFPYRSKKEIVSYYFNVFMLRRRAAQNRSSWLEIDSDDDEWNGVGGSLGMTREDENSAGITFMNQDVWVEHGNDSENEYDYDNDDSSSDGPDGNGDNDDGDEHDTVDNDDPNLQVGEVYAEYMEGKNHLLKGDSEYSDDHRSDHLAKSFGSFKELLDVEENSCTSFEIEPCVTDSHHQINDRAAIQETKDNAACEKSLDGNGEGSADKFGCEYALDSCDSKGWDVSYPLSIITSVDLLPTCNMMEEIFGPCDRNNSNNDTNVS